MENVRETVPVTGWATLGNRNLKQAFPVAPTGTLDHRTLSVHPYCTDVWCEWLSACHSTVSLLGPSCNDTTMAHLQILLALSNYGGRGLVRENTETHVTPPNELQATVAEMGETAFTASTDCVLHQFSVYGRVTKRKKIILNL